jgi:hypothetical protein
MREIKKNAITKVAFPKINKKHVAALASSLYPMIRC